MYDRSVVWINLSIPSVVSIFYIIGMSITISSWLSEFPQSQRESRSGNIFKNDKQSYFYGSIRLGDSVLRTDSD